MIDSPSYKDEKNKKGVKPSVTRLLNRLPPSDLYTNKHKIVHTSQVRTSSLLVLGVENWRYSLRREQEPKAPYLYLSRTNGTRC